MFFSYDDACFATRLHFFFRNFVSDMKNRPHIVLLAVAIICMLLMMAVPHHHHAMGVCLMQEICHQDGRVNDSHTHHSEASDTHHIIPVTGKHLSLGSMSDLGSGHSCWTPFFLLGLPGIDVGALCAPLFFIRRVYACALPAWHGQPVLSGHGLRAPPFSVL